eukprot:363205-Chlamydomonas_euryale.AAC.9
MDERRIGMMHFEGEEHLLEGESGAMACTCVVNEKLVALCPRLRLQPHLPGPSAALGKTSVFHATSNGSCDQLRRPTGGDDLAVATAEESRRRRALTPSFLKTALGRARLPASKAHRQHVPREAKNRSIGGVGRPLPLCCVWGASGPRRSAETMPACRGHRRICLIRGSRVEARERRPLGSSSVPDSKQRLWPLASTCPPPARRRGRNAPTVRPGKQPAARQCRPSSMP